MTTRLPTSATLALLFAACAVSAGADGGDVLSLLLAEAGRLGAYYIAGRSGVRTELHAMEARILKIESDCRTNHGR